MVVGPAPTESVPHRRIKTPGTERKESCFRTESCGGEGFMIPPVK